ncbi:glycerol ethanol, ferric requiring protein [Pichia californica]|uniref:Chloride channel protein n=1 Tax=Pichia californica TaxID=460514 RepID=A0A9P6WN92_9ASCO|nr:glycerol ethanol, ferric requiring protein [[Candida] californica]KAG0690255.1 glycerol ethanol, ferric requiring protein [[Candida] californica]
MPEWQQEYNSDPDVRQLSKNFDKFTTIDWPLQRINENRQYYDALKNRSINLNNLSNDLNRFEDNIELGNERYINSNRLNSSESNEINNSLRSFNSTATSIINEISKFKLIKSRLWLTVQIWLVLTITGILIGSIAAILSILTEYLNSFKIGYCSTNLFLNEKICKSEDWKIWSNYKILSFLIFTILSLIFGLFSSFLCIYFAPNASGSGISEVKCIVSGFNRNEFLNLSTLIIKAISLPFTISSGLNVGKEGPSVHYSSCIGNVISRLIVPWFNESPLQLSDIIIASAGSGVAVAFGSPIGGVLFSIEEISSNLRINTLWKTFYTSLIAITTLQIWNPFKTGQIVMFEVKYNSNWNWNEIIWFIILGIFGGLYGILVSKLNIKYVLFRQKYLLNFKFSGLIEIFWLILITSILSYWNIFTRFDMTKVMELLFDPCSKIENNNPICLILNDENDSNLFKWLWILFELIYATIIRIFLVCISYGSKVPCGIFVPSMAIGATFGKLLGILVEEIFNKNDNLNGNIPSGIYSFLGAGAALSGITGLTFTVVVIMYELTGAIKYIIPTMITIITVRIVNEIGGNGFGGIADQMIKFNGLPFIDLKEQHDELGEAVNVKDLMVSKIIGLDLNGMFENDILKIMKFEKREYPILFKRKHIIGILSHLNLIKIIETIRNEENTDLNLNGNEINLNNKFIRFISKEKMNEINKRIIGETIDYYDNDDNNDDYNEISFDELIEFEFLSINFKTSVFTLFDLFVEIGSRIIYVNDDNNKIVGLISRKDLIRYENYIHYKNHGNVFINENDLNNFEKLWKFYLKTWKLIKFWDHDNEDIDNNDSNDYVRL